MMLYFGVKCVMMYCHLYGQKRQSQFDKKRVYVCLSVCVCLYVSVFLLGGCVWKLCYWPLPADQWYRPRSSVGHGCPESTWGDAECIGQSGETASQQSRLRWRQSDPHLSQHCLLSALCLFRKLCYKSSSIVTFTFVQISYQNCAFFTEWHPSCRLCLIQRQNSCYFRCLVWKTKSWLKKQTYMETETYKLYSRILWIFLPNFVKIDPYNFQLYRFKVHFLRHSVITLTHATYGAADWLAACIAEPSQCVAVIRLTLAGSCLCLYIDQIREIWQFLAALCW